MEVIVTKFRLVDARSLFNCDDKYIENLQMNGFTVTEKGDTEIEINTLDELMTVMDIVGTRLVVSKEKIIIYNDYIE